MRHTFLDISKILPRSYKHFAQDCKILGFLGKTCPRTFCWEWKVIDGVVEDWICIPKFGAHILWGNDMDEAQRTPLDYWMMSFPSQMLADISIWTSNCLPQRRANLMVKKKKYWPYLVPCIL